MIVPRFAGHFFITPLSVRESVGSIGIVQISVCKTSDFRRQRTDGRTDGRSEILGSAELSPFPKRLRPNLV